MIGLLLQFVSISVPFLAAAFKVQNLSFADWGVVIGLALIPLLINEVIKVFGRMSRAKAA
ncbi:Calcium-transporting ATPase 1 [compost metagenome]